MSTEKTEKATPRRRKEAREKGNILRSIELSSAVILLFSFLALKLFGGSIIKNLTALFAAVYRGEYMESLEGLSGSYAPIMSNILGHLALVLAPVFLVACATSLAINYVQVGFLFVPSLLKPKADKLNPVSGLKKMFSLRTLVEFVKSAVKMAIVGWIAYGEMRKNHLSFINLVYADVPQSAQVVWDIVMSLLLKTGGALLAFSVLDYLYQWWEYEKSLRMSKQEIKEEYKLLEGDPKIKQRIRDIQRQMAMRRMMQQVPRADVVITNPVHYAVALLYREEEHTAPVVVAKGKDYQAIRIKEVAREHGVHIVENRPLARSLYNTTELNQPIPEELYHAVAEILAAVYRAKGMV